MDEETRLLLEEAERRGIRLDFENVKPVSIYQEDPVGYTRDKLGLRLWAKQRAILESLVFNEKTFVKGSYNTGKSFVVAAGACWCYDEFDPAEVLITAPAAHTIDDIIFKYIRGFRRGADMPPQASRVERPGEPNHYVSGYTARKGGAFQGRHSFGGRVFVFFEECVDIDPTFWDGAFGMVSGEGCRMLAACNPTATDGRAYEEEISGDWNSITVSAMEHPNILAGLHGLPEPYPGGLSLRWLEWAIEKYCDPIREEDAAVGDFAFPFPHDGNLHWYRPSPWFEGRVFGRWPSQSATNLWTEALWNYCLQPQPERDDPVEIGCDVARFGDDDTVIHVRRGAVSLHHEWHNGWEYDRTAERLKELAGTWGIPRGMTPKRVPIKIDEIGNGVVSHAKGYSFYGINSSRLAFDPETYDKVRSEIWVLARDKAKAGRIDFSRLDKDSKKFLKGNLLAVRYGVDGHNRVVVEPKDRTKSRLKGRSPDHADAFNYSHARGTGVNFRMQGKSICAPVGRIHRVDAGVIPGLVSSKGI